MKANPMSVAEYLRTPGYMKSLQDAWREECINALKARLPFSFIANRVTIG